MKSLLWVNQFALMPGDGGGTRHFELGRELVQRDWQVSVLASDLHLHKRTYTRRSGDDRSAIRQQPDGVDFRWLFAARYERNDWRRAYNWYTFNRSVVRELRAFSPAPDVVIGSSPQLFAATAARTLAKRLGVPFVFEVRDLWPESLLAAGGRKGLAYRVFDHVAQGLYRDADCIIALARGTRDYLVEHDIDANKIVYVPNGVDTNAIGAGTERFDADRNTPFTLIYAGAHGPANGLDAVLDAAERLGADSNVKFLLVGDGPAKQALRDDANKRQLGNVEFRDPVAKSDLALLLRDADAGLMILRDAPLFAFGVSPNKLFDYLAAALPVVCNVPGEVASMLADAQGGVQATDSSGAALARAIETLRDTPVATRRTMGTHGREWVDQNHSRGVLGDKLDRILTDLIVR